MNSQEPPSESFGVLCRHTPEYKCSIELQPILHGGRCASLRAALGKYDSVGKVPQGDADEYPSRSSGPLVPLSRR